MAKISLQVEVSKETYELGKGIAEFVEAMKVALANGWQPMDDLPVALKATVTKLVPAIKGVDGIPQEITNDKTAFVRALALSMADIAEPFVKGP